MLDSFPLFRSKVEETKIVCPTAPVLLGGVGAWAWDLCLHGVELEARVDSEVEIVVKCLGLHGCSLPFIIIV